MEIDRVIIIIIIQILFKINYTEIVIISQDAHWSLYSSHCSVCMVNFTTVVHMEDREELGSLLSQTGLAHPDQASRNGWYSVSRTDIFDLL